MLLGPDGRPIQDPGPEKPAPKRPRRRRRPKPEVPVTPATSGDAVRDRLERGLKWIEPFGLGVHGSGFFLGWWKKLGLNWAIALSLGFFVPVSQFSLLNFAMTHGVPYMLGDFGVTFEAEDWDLHLLGLRGIAHNVRIARDSKAAPVLTATEVEFNATLGSIVGRLIGRPQTFDQIIIRDADVRLEQSLTGDWNWSQFIDTVPAERKQAVARGQYQTRGLTLDRVRIEYLEHIPGNSGGGVIQTAQARVYADDVSGEVRNLIAPGTHGDLPTTFELKGRSSDGIVQIVGRGAFFAFADQPGSAIPVDVKLYLENIGMGTYGRTVATTSLLPIRGTVRGTLEVKRNGGALTCRSTLVANDVEFAPNPRVVLVRAQYDQLADDLRGYRAAGPFDPCGTGQPQPHQTATAVLASFNSQTTLSAPSTVRAAVARDERSFGRAVASSATSDITDRLAQQVGRRAGALIGGNTGETVEKQGGNALTKGARNVGSGFKKLFGR